MHKPIYDDKKTKERTKIVRSYFLETDKERKQIIYQKIIDYTQLCFYQIPYKLKILPEDNLSEFLLSVMSQIDSIIESFKLSNCDYDPFLVSVIKSKARYFYINKNYEEEKNNVILKCDSLINEPGIKYSTEKEIVINQKVDPSFISGKLKKSDLRPIFEKIINTHYKERIIKNYNQNILHQYLKNPIHRKFLLLQILFTHNELESDEIDYYSTLFDVSPYLFDNLDYCLQLWCKSKIDKIEEEKLKATKHWKRLMLYDKTLHEPISSDERQEILLLKKRCISMINKNSKSIYQKSKGIDSNQLADIFDTTQNRLLVFFCKQKKEFAKYLLQLNEKETTGIIKPSFNYNEVGFDNLLCKWQ